MEDHLGVLKALTLERHLTQSGRGPKTIYFFTFSSWEGLSGLRLGPPGVPPH